MGTDGVATLVKGTVKETVSGSNFNYLDRHTFVGTMLDTTLEGALNNNIQDMRVANGVLYILVNLATGENYLYAIDTATLQIKWRTLDLGYIGIQIYIAGWNKDRIYVFSFYNGKIFQINTADGVVTGEWTP
jgi:outer membrane protein assembly factor BamB